MASPESITLNLRNIGGTSGSGFDPDHYHALSGSFGTKAVTDVVYENFDSRALGAISSDVGRLKRRGSAGGGSIAASTTFSGRKCWEQNYAVSDLPEIYVQLQETQRAYHACHFRFSGSISGASCSWKFGRVGINTDPYLPNRYAHMYTSSGQQSPNSSAPDLTVDTSIVREWSGTNEASDNPSLFQQNSNIFYEYECFAGTVEGADSVFVVRANGYELVKFSGSSMRTTANSGLIRTAMAALVGMQNTTSNTMIYQMSEVYFDASRARIIMTNNATFSASTKFAVQPLYIWRESSVIAEKNAPNFSIGEAAFLHVWNDDGVKVGTAIPVTVDANYTGAS